MSKSLIIGLGTGRCGTLSLAVVLDAQYLTSVTHEVYYKLPWHANYDALKHTLRCIYMHAGEAVGDAGFYYLPYVEKIIELTKYVKFVCLKRDKDETIDSQLRAGRSLWHMHVVAQNSKYFDPVACDLNNAENRAFRASFPKYDLPLEDAWAKYYDDYYEKAAYFEKVYPGMFKIFDMNSVLNTEDGQYEMLKFVDLKSQFILNNIRIFKEFTGDPDQFKNQIE